MSFESSYNHIGDFDLFIRLSKICEFDAIQEPVATYRVHGENLSLKNAEKEIEEMKKWLQLISNLLNKIQKKQVLKIKEWTDKHPNYCEDDDLYTEYQQLVRATMCLNPIENEDIGKNISNIVNINDVVNK